MWFGTRASRPVVHFDYDYAICESAKKEIAFCVLEIVSISKYRLSATTYGLEPTAGKF